jgi:hypothetical protein
MQPEFCVTRNAKFKLSFQMKTSNECIMSEVDVRVQKICWLTHTCIEKVEPSFILILVTQTN